MAMSEGDNISDVEETHQKRHSEVDKEIAKLEYYLEPADELIETNDFEEMRVVIKQSSMIISKLSDLVSQLEGLKIDSGMSTRTVRQWKKDVKARYSNWLGCKERLCEALSEKEKLNEDETQRREWEAKQQLEEAVRRDRHEQERLLWEEKLKAELEMTTRKLEMERQVRFTSAKLPKLKITPFKGTASDWIRFENIFLSQIDQKLISDEEKFGYLLELVNGKVRERFSNLKPGTEGYKTAWARLKREYGQTKQVINAHMEEIIGLPVIKGSNYERVQEFYEKISKAFDALQTLGEDAMLRGLVMTTLNKLPHIKPDLVRTDEKWEDWSMKELLDNIHKWLIRNKGSTSWKPKEDSKQERNWYSQKNDEDRQAKPKTPKCVYCQGEHWSDRCQEISQLEQRRKFFKDNKLCYNCGQQGHRASQCRGRSCFKCKAKHHTSLCDGKDVAMLTGFTPEEASLPAIIPVNIQGITLWAYLDTGSGRNFISQDAVRKLKLSPDHHETRHIITVNSSKKTSMPVYQVNMDSLDGKVREKITVTGTKMPDFTTFRRPDMNNLKSKYDHTKDKKFYMQPSNNYPIHLIIGDNTFCRIKTQEIYKGEPEDPIVEGTTFGWVVHGGDIADNNKCLYVRDTNDYESLYSLDVLGVEDRAENDQLDIHTEFREGITKDEEGRYEVNIPWIPGAELVETNEPQSRRRLQSVMRKVKQDTQLQEEYKNIVLNQLEEGIIERVPDEPTGDRIFYLPHKPVVKESATTTKVRMVFDASAKPTSMTRSVNECMYTGPALQPLLWDIMIRARMSPHLLLGDIQKAFLQIGLKPEDRDAFRFLFELDGKEEHLRLTRIPFGAEASPFILGAVLQYHYDQQAEGLVDTLDELRTNTYVDNLMKNGNSKEELESFKKEATIILGEGKFPTHKWESTVSTLESDDVLNPGKILGLTWDKQDDTLEVQVPKKNESQPVTKKSILSQLGSIYDPLGLISPTMVEGKRIYREACDENRNWDSNVSPALAKSWLRWRKQLRTVKVPRSLIKSCKKVNAIHLHLFADASNLACSATTIAVVEQDTETAKGLLTSKSRISKRNTTIPRLELVSGQMAANLARNVANALKRWPISTITIWMDSMVALYWISNPGRSWKVFIANRVKKIAEVTKEVGIQWKHCPSEKNVADLGSRGASLNQLEKKNWYTGPEWLLQVEDWPRQPTLTCSSSATEEEKPVKEIIAYNQENDPDEWEQLLISKSYWSTLRITAWVLRFVKNCLAKSKAAGKIHGPLSTAEILDARNSWVRKVQRSIPKDTESPGWRLEEDKNTGIVKCIGRIQGYTPTYLEKGLFVQKLIRFVHEQILHLGVGSTMAAMRESWWIPRLRSLVKKLIHQCHTCKAFSTKPYEKTDTAPLPQFRTEASRPFQTTGVDFAGPLVYKVNKKEDGKASIIIFTCAAMRAVHLEVTKTQTAEEFQEKLNAFITRRTRPRRIVSDNAAVFRATAQWIKRLRKSEELHNYLAKQEIKWQFNLSKSPWWGGMYERIIKEIKKSLYKTMGKTHLTFEQLNSVVMDIERHLNNRPLMYIESDGGEEQILTPNTIMWGQEACALQSYEEDEEDDVGRVQRRLNTARRHAWCRWKKQYVNSLMEFHRIVKGDGHLPKVGEIVLVVGEEKNRGVWKKGKVLRHIKGKDGVVRGVVLLHKQHEIERPIQLVCPLEIRSTSHEEPRRNPPRLEEEPKRDVPKRKAAEKAKRKITELLTDDE